jgi:hypothetical protein
MKTVMTAYSENRPCAISRHSCHLAFTEPQKIKSAELYLGIDVQDALAASENLDILSAIGAFLVKHLRYQRYLTTFNINSVPC